ncbi:MAG: PIN domain-containing protein [Haliscomenobacter sp.]|nr:PIN domain-containing protein [Haliscomenobacter sp.]
MDSVFADTNLLLDWLGKREPFFEPARDLLIKAERKEITLLVSTLSFVTLAYILRKEIGAEKTLKALTGIRAIATVCSSGEKEIDLALVSRFKDFEDAFQYYTALNHRAAAFVTRNTKDFKHAEIPVMTAEEYLRGLG